MARMRTWTVTIAVAFLIGSCGIVHDDRSPIDSDYVGENHNSDRVIVFVHGFRGNANTWKSPHSTLDWPHLLAADPVFNGSLTSPRADVFVFRHPSRWDSGYSVQDAARLMLRVLEARGVTDHRELLFVCHSMGGLVTIEFLTGVGKQYAAKTRLVYLVATPGNGSEFAKIGTFVSNNPQLGQMIEGGSESYLTDLKLDWLDLACNAEVLCAYETQPAEDSLRVVRASSALAFAKRGHSATAAGDGDHSEIARPWNTENDDVYLLLWSAYQSLDGPPGEPSEPLVSLRVDHADGVVPFTLDVSAVAENMRPTSYRWFHGSKELDLTTAESRVVFDEPGEHPLRVVVSDGRKEIEDTVTIRAQAPIPRSETRVITAKIVTDSTHIRDKDGDDEIDSDDWSKIAVQYSTRILDAGAAIELNLIWEAFELEANKSFKRGNTRYRSETKQVVWAASADEERAVAVLTGAEGSAVYMVKGKCVGRRTYGRVGGIAHPMIAFDAKGRRDDLAQSFRGEVELTIAIESSAGSGQPPR